MGARLRASKRCPYQPMRHILLILLISSFFLTACGPARENRIVVGSKNFTEQAILGEIFAQRLNAKPVCASSGAFIWREPSFAIKPSSLDVSTSIRNTRELR